MTEESKPIKVSDIKAKQGNITVELEVVTVGEARPFATFNGSGKVANAAAKDETGEIKVSLWNDQCTQVREGDRIRIENGYCSEYKGERQLSTGKFGTLTVVRGEKPDNS